MDRALATDADVLVGTPKNDLVFIMGSIQWKRGGRWPKAIEFTNITRPAPVGASMPYTLIVQRKAEDPKNALYGSFTERMTWDPTMWGAGSVSRALTERMSLVDHALRHGSAPRKA